MTDHPHTHRPSSVRALRLARSRDLTCPACGSALLRLRAASGAFVGCARYPRCSYTRRSLRLVRLTDMPSKGG